jgi:hypothetical protein
MGWWSGISCGQLAHERKDQRGKYNKKISERKKKEMLPTI